VGKKELVEQASYRLTAPGLGGEMGCTLGDTAREFYQGLFMAPHVALQAVKTSMFAASVFQSLGFEVSPLPDDVRSDIIQTITLKTPENPVCLLRSHPGSFSHRCPRNAGTVSAAWLPG
jgi:cystathionine beta-lyase family protein involved in aluminum resistance